MATRALLLHSDPDELLPLLVERCPDADWRAAATPDEVEPTLATHRPEVVFSIKHNGFPGPAHRPALAAPDVRWFQVGGSGRDHLGTWDPARVTVTTCAGVLAPFLAERALAALLSLATGLPGLLRAQAERRWSPTTFRPLAGRTLLVVGVGHTGGEFAARARSLGMHVIGVRTSRAPHPALDEVHGPDALYDLLPRADVLSLHVPLGDATRHLIDARALAALPVGALVLNAARGAVVDPDALVAELERAPSERRIAGAWLDVFETEPLPSDHALWSLENLLLTPHCADQADGWPILFAERFADNWERRRRGQDLVGVVRP
ncbi:(S)-sulfolactate dehydrogenase [Planctomycetes bacterium Pla163]|uniref:(S)-sulfolactate dehydrogenase n=1 Tax=Rohdeia mirabilis TaxID=2528008 RepID=A0A518CVP3_9BACT|nr:(S)-sulfolactate dehydrogenase [Planctomycetes bacterium Pla163]